MWIIHYHVTWTCKRQPLYAPSISVVVRYRSYTSSSGTPTPTGPAVPWPAPAAAEAIGHLDPALRLLGAAVAQHAVDHRRDHAARAVGADLGSPTMSWFSPV